MSKLVRQINQLKSAQVDLACVLANAIVSRGEDEQEAAELSELLSRDADRRAVLSFVGLFVAFSMLTWPLLMRGM